MGPDQSVLGAPFGCDVFDPNGEVLVVISGELDVATVADLHACLDEVLSMAKPVLVDLARTDFVGAVGFRALAAAARRAQASGVPLTILTRSPLVARLLRAAAGTSGVVVTVLGGEGPDDQGPGDQGS